MAELRCTYRLQLTPDFGFAQAQAVIPYLRDLGISHLYLSPSLQACPGSTHGYDVTDPSRMSDGLGGESGFAQLAGAARAAGLGIVLDVVPNHMAADDGNRFWADAALRERFFDVDPATGRWRRFFDVDDLAAVRQELPEVFEATHERVLRLVRDGVVDGLRVDHPDGLADPAGYLAQLRAAGAERVWVEKILDPNEQLRDWAVTGTVGYEFLNDVSALFVDPGGEPAMTALWQETSGDRRPFSEYAIEAKRQQIEGPFRPELERLGRVVPDVALEDLARALASLPVYRTYVDPAERVVAEADRAAIAEAEQAGMSREIAQMLLLERPAPEEFVIRFQQTTPAVMAKGVEDTVFYRYARLLALNDVGGDPSRFGLPVAAFHDACLERARRFPENLLVTQTHDTKRSLDVRARIAVLASMAEVWRAAVEEWFALTEELRSDGAPDDVERYFIFQTLAGAWPIERERIDAYIEKALREAKRNTSWVDGNPEWEDAVKRFCEALYTHRPFLDAFEPFVRRLARRGRQAAMGQHVLKLTVPGIPDIFQGDEFPRRTLVDPDNRRPVDWDYNQVMLRRLMGGAAPTPETERQFVTLRLLGLRARRPELFRGGYEPIEAGPDACAFTRGGELLVAVATRTGEQAGERTGGLVSGLPAGGRWRDLLRGEERPLGASAPLDGLLGPHGFAVFERLSG